MGNADKIRERMRQSKHGWTGDDLDRLYLGFGFIRRDGSKHIVDFHPDHPELMATVTRARELPAGYIQSALRLIDRLEEVSKEPPDDDRE